MKTAKKILIMLLALGLIMSFVSKKSEVTNEDDPKKELEHFPKAKEGMVRYVIFLDKKTNENLYQIELIPGKVMNVDCNIHSLIGKIEEKNLEGWGYTYYDFSSDGNTMSTQMSCPKQENKNKYISAQSIMIRYNSKLPIVIYAPKGYEIHYKIWEAGKDKKSLED